MSRMPVWVILLFALWIVPVVPAQTSGRDYAAAWTAGGDLYVLLPEDSAPRVIAEGRASIPRLSPDAAFVAFQRGDSLFVVGTDGTDERVLFDAENAPADLVNENNLVSAGRRTWLDTDTLLFNTFQYNDFVGFGNDDLHIMNVRMSESIRAEIGGEFAPAPDGTQIAVAVAGFYGEFPGTIHIVDANGTNPREVMRYTAVATATEGQFVPQIQWVDAQTFRVAIPDPDLIYLDDAQTPPPTALWEVNATTGEAVQIGDGQVIFSGLPVWNESGSRLVSLTWAHSETNRIALTIANGDGSSAEQFASADRFGISLQGWVPDNAESGERFVYLQDGILHLSGLSATDAPLRLDETPVRPQVAIHATGVVYAVELADGTNEVRAVGFDGGDPVSLATTGESRPRINAVSLKG